MMKSTALALALSFALALAAAAAPAQEQKPGQPLYFPKKQVGDRPSDLHMGSDPYYRPGSNDIQGSDEAGYPQTYDPQQEAVEEETVYKRVDRYEENAPPPSRWQQ